MPALELISPANHRPSPSIERKGIERPYSPKEQNESSGKTPSNPKSPFSPPSVRKIVDEQTLRRQEEQKQKKAEEEQKQLDLVRKKAEEEQKLLEVARKKAEEEQKQLEIARKKAEEAQKLLEMARKKAEEENQLKLEMKKAEEQKLEMARKKEEENKMQANRRKMEEQRKLEAIKRQTEDQKQKEEACKKAEQEQKQASQKEISLKELEVASTVAICKWIRENSEIDEDGCNLLVKHKIRWPTLLKLSEDTEKLCKCLDMAFGDADILCELVKRKAQSYKRQELPITSSKPPSISARFGTADAESVEFKGPLIVNKPKGTCKTELLAAQQTLVKYVPLLITVIEACEEIIIQTIARRPLTQKLVGSPFLIFYLYK